MRTWFAVENSLVDRNDLTAYEKLCGMVLARYAGRPEFDHLLTTDIIAVKMGVSSEMALVALRGLVEKGLIDVDSASDLFVEGSDNHIKEIEIGTYIDEKDSGIIKSESGKAQVQPMAFENLDNAPYSDDGPGHEDEMWEEDGFDNLDKLLARSKEAEAHLGESEASVDGQNLDLQAGEAFTSKPSQDDKSQDKVKNTPYKRGLLNYQNAKKITGKDVHEYDVNQVTDKADDLDPEMLTKSIHEQSDSVRQWIEKSEPAVAAFREKQESQPQDREGLVASVMAMIEEPINDRQARIILGLAQYDLDKVKKCYQVAQNTQVADKIDMLIHELQKKEAPEAPRRVPRTSQVDHIKLNQMKKYQAMKKN